MSIGTSASNSLVELYNAEVSPHVAFGAGGIADVSFILPKNAELNPQ